MTSVQILGKEKCPLLGLVKQHISPPLVGREKYSRDPRTSNKVCAHNPPARASCELRPQIGHLNSYPRRQGRLKPTPHHSGYSSSPPHRVLRVEAEVDDVPRPRSTKTTPTRPRSCPAPGSGSGSAAPTRNGTGASRNVERPVGPSRGCTSPAKRTENMRPRRASALGGPEGSEHTRGAMKAHIHNPKASSPRAIRKSPISWDRSRYLPLARQLLRRHVKKGNN